MARPKLYIIEGPAGSGKTTTLRKLVGSNLVDTMAPLTPIDRPRAYEGIHGIALSMLKDYSTMINLAMDLQIDQYPHRRYAIDRWVMSQAVYGIIRRQESFSIDPQVLWDQFHQSMATALNVVYYLFRDLEARSGLPGSPQLKLDIVYVVQLPSRDQLLRQRAKASRDFPYDEDEELGLYNLFARHLREHPIVLHSASVTAHLLEYESTDDYQRAYGLLTERLLGL